MYPGKKVASHLTQKKKGERETQHSMAWEVHKFGGTSVASAAAMSRVVDIVKLQHRGGARIAVVVSAMGSTETLAKTTDLLLSTVAAAVRGDMQAVRDTLGILKRKHDSCISEIFGESAPSGLRDVMFKELDDVMSILKGVRLLRSTDDRTSGIVSGYGELWSADAFSMRFSKRKASLRSWWMLGRC